MPSTTALTIVIFAATIVLVLVKPKDLHEAWWTISGATLMLMFGLVAPHDLIVVARAGKGAMLFLLSLLLLSALLERSGFFDWAAIVAGQRSHGSAKILFRNVFVLGAIITAALSLDTTAVILTPIVLALVKRVRVSALPYVVACAFVANVGSLLLPVSNLTNIIFADAFHLSFVAFFVRMVAPQIAALAVAFLLLRWHFRSELRGGFDEASLPSPASQIPHVGYFRASGITLSAVLIGYFVAPLVGLESYVVGFAGVAALSIVGVAFARVRPAMLRDVSWGVFPFVCGLFVVVQGVENIGVAVVATRWLSHFEPNSLLGIGAAAGLAGVASNLMNNLPAALIARTALEGVPGHPALQFAALIGTDLGPTIFPFGSLATLLVLSSARAKGTRVRASEVIAPGIWITPLVVATAAVTLAASFALAK